MPFLIQGRYLGVLKIFFWPLLVNVGDGLGNEWDIIGFTKSLTEILRRRFSLVTEGRDNLRITRISVLATTLKTCTEWNRISIRLIWRMWNIFFVPPIFGFSLEIIGIFEILMGFLVIPPILFLNLTLVNNILKMIYVIRSVPITLSPIKIQGVSSTLKKGTG